jgi:hypothetical protein
MTVSDIIRLAHGAHISIDDGACAMEAAAWIAGEPWSDHPKCASPVISQFMRTWNDSLNDDDRQMLKPYIVKVVGTHNGAKIENRRAWMAADWLVRTQTPMWLRLAGLADQAAALEQLIPLTDTKSARAAQPVIDAAHERAASAWAAAGAAAWAAAWAAAGAAAGAAAWAAAGAAARAAAWDAAWDAAWAALRPTAESLQQSALGLLDRMIALHRTDVPVLADRVAQLGIEMPAGATA